MGDKAENHEWLFRRISEQFEEWEALPEPSWERGQIAKHLAQDIRFATIVCEDDPPRFLHYANMALLVAPEEPAFMLLHAGLLYTAGRYDDALRLIDKIGYEDPLCSCGAQKIAYRIHMVSGEIEEAFNALTFAIMDDPDNTRIWFREPMQSEVFTDIRRNLGNILKNLDTLIDQEPANSMNAMVKGAFLYSIGRKGLISNPTYIDYMSRLFKAPHEAFSAASDAFQQATSDPCFATRAYTFIGFTEILRNTPENLDPLYRKAIAERPQDAEILKRDLGDLQAYAAARRRHNMSIAAEFGHAAKSVYRQIKQLVTKIVPKGPQP